MKKYFLTFIIAIIIGFFLANFFINQYSSYDGIKVSSNGETLYFIQYGVFSSETSMEENTISLESYVYNTIDNMYYVYIGITENKDNANKIIEYYKGIGYNVILKEYSVTNKEFLKLLKNYDEVLKNTVDKTALSSVINQVLLKYEEVVINGN